MVPSSTVRAGRNAGGALIVHTDDAYTYSHGTACTTPYGNGRRVESGVYWLIVRTSSGYTTRKLVVVK